MLRCPALHLDILVNKHPFIALYRILGFFHLHSQCIPLRLFLRADTAVNDSTFLIFRHIFHLIRTYEVILIYENICRNVIFYPFLTLSFSSSTFPSIALITCKNTSSLLPVGSSSPQSSLCLHGRNGHSTLQPMVMTMSTGGISDSSLLRCVFSMSMS